MEHQEKKKEGVTKENDIKNEIVESSEPTYNEITNLKEAEKTNANLDDKDAVDNITPELDNNVADKQDATEYSEIDEEIRLLKAKINGLTILKDKLLQNIDEEKNAITDIKKQLINESNGLNIPNLNEANSQTLDGIMHLLYEENQILQIKKLNLVRQIMEQHEICVDLRAKLETLTVT